MNTLEQFRDLMIRQMETTAADELMAKITTRKLESTNKTLIEDIEGKHIHTIIRNIHFVCLVWDS